MMHRINKFFEINRYFISLSFFSVFLILFFVKIYLLNDYWLQLDEVYSATFFSHYPTFFAKVTPNNHFLTSIIGSIIISLFGFKFIILKLISFFSFCFIAIIFRKIMNNFLLLSLFFILVLSSDYLYTALFAFRGYYFSSFLFCLIFFFFIKFNEKFEEKHLIYILFISALLFCHNLSTFFLVFPIGIILFFIMIRNLSFKKFFIYSQFFIIPFLLINFIQIVRTSIQVEGNWAEFENFQLNLAHIKNLRFQDHNLFQLIKDIFLFFYEVVPSGFNHIFFDPYLDSRSEIHIFSKIMLKYEPTMFFVFTVSFLYSIFNLFRKKYISLSLIVIFFVITYFTLYRNPPFTVHVGYIYFLILFIFYSLNSDIKKIYKAKIYPYLTLAIFFFALFFLINKDFEPIPPKPGSNGGFSLGNYNEVFVEYSKELSKNNCKLVDTMNLGNVRQLYYVVYVEFCNKKYNREQYVGFLTYGKI